MIPIRDHYKPLLRPFINNLLIIINIIVFIYTFTLSIDQLELFIYDYALIPSRFSFFSLITSQFLHGGFGHIIGNMLFLHIFGDNLEDKLGHFKYLLYYLLCGIFAGLTQYLINPGSEIPVIGASGAIAGAMGGYLISFPDSKVDVLLPLGLLFPLVTIPAFAMLIYWITTQLFLGSLSAGVDAGGVAYSAHLGGFIAGALLVLIIPPRLGFTRHGYTQN